MLARLRLMALEAALFACIFVLWWAGIVIAACLALVLGGWGVLLGAPVFLVWWLFWRARWQATLMKYFPHSQFLDFRTGDGPWWRPKPQPPTADTPADAAPPKPQPRRIGQAPRAVESRALARLRRIADQRRFDGA
jgi:hypothetical protein